MEVPSSSPPLAALQVLEADGDDADGLLLPSLPHVQPPAVRHPGDDVGMEEAARLGGEDQAVDLFQLPPGETWMKLGAWKHVGEFESREAALEHVRKLCAADPKVNEWDFEIQGKMRLN